MSSMRNYFISDSVNLEVLVRDVEVPCGSTGACVKLCQLPVWKLTLPPFLPFQQRWKTANYANIRESRLIATTRTVTAVLASAMWYIRNGSTATTAKSIGNEIGDKSYDKLGSIPS